MSGSSKGVGFVGSDELEDSTGGQVFHSKSKGVNFGIDDSVKSIASSDKDNSDHMQETEFHAKFGSTTSTPPRILKKSFSYKVVGRLSRWEGGNTNPYSAADDTGGDEKIIEIEPEKVSCGEFCRQFFSPSYDLTEVTVEDIDRTKIMHDRFLGSAQFDFNYSTLLLIASAIAGLGLANNSGATIIASMLVSPLMGPVTSIAYGLSIGDFKMVRMGLVTEILSLVFCVIVGLVFAAIMLPFQIADDWPVNEMTSRGTKTNFWVGIPIAFFSGLGVAVGLLDSQTNSLVGVAISASLLPPAVNCGMLFVIEMDANFGGRYYREGLISLGLTLANIVFIIIASMIMFRLKETLPIRKSIFWTDLGIARKIYHNVAIIPRVQKAPDDAEIKKRVTKFFPRASAMIFASDFKPPSSDSSSGPDHATISSMKQSSFRYQWSVTGNDVSADANHGLKSITE